MFNSRKSKGLKSYLSVRLMRILTATGILRAVAENVYAHTRFSLAYLDGSEVDFFELWYFLVSLAARGNWL